VPGADRELDAGARAHYQDPDFYTANYRRRIDDVQFYVACAARSGGPVLEYGVGNGRVALPIARHGVDVVGVDHARPMLADLKRRLAEEAPEVRRRVRLREGDMRAVRLRRRFPLVTCPFNAALHLYTRDDVERFLARVRAHLAPRGRFVFDVSMPVNEDLARSPDRPYRAPRFTYPGEGVVRYEEYFDYDRIRQILFVSMRFEPVRRPERRFTVPLAHRQFFPAEMEALLHYNGLEVERLDGDFHGGPLGRESDVMVFVTRARRGFA
jgi:SAM-dependent methyltransferase